MDLVLPGQNTMAVEAVFYLSQTPYAKVLAGAEI